VINRFERLGFFPEERMPSEQVNSTCFLFLTRLFTLKRTHPTNQSVYFIFFERERDEFAAGHLKKILLFFFFFF
jgi:hypothetical protein